MLTWQVSNETRDHVSYTENFAQLRWGGKAWMNTEQWSCGVKLKHLGGDDLAGIRDECVATIQECADLIEAYVLDGQTHHSAGCTLDWVRLNAISKDTGKYAYPNSPNIVEGINGAAGGMYGIPQVAYCVTLRGLQRRGPGSFGRYFVPVANLDPAADGRLASGTALQLANKAGTFLTDLGSIDSGLGPDAWQPWLFGIGGEGTVAQKTGVDSAIDSVEVGRVFDTQRRRRNSLLEAYEVATTWT